MRYVPPSTRRACAVRFFLGVTACLQPQSISARADLQIGRRRFGATRPVNQFRLRPNEFEFSGDEHSAFSSSVYHDVDVCLPRICRRRRRPLADSPPILTENVMRGRAMMILASAV